MSQVSPSTAVTAATLPVAQVNADQFDQAALGIKPLPLDNLVSGVEVPLDIFLPGVNEQDNTVVPSRIIAAGQAPTETHLDLIRRSGFAHVFFRGRDQGLVLDYLARRAKDMVGDALVPVIDKARLLYDNAMYLVEAALTLPHMTENVRRGQQYIESVVRFVAGTPEAAEALVGLLEVDYTWFNHSVNVCLLSVSFGHFLGLASDDIVTLGLGTLLHDIGKREVPQEILVKPGPLSESENEIMRRHPVTGAWTLANIGEVPAAAVRVVRHHHENMDGSGYPDGL
ncbi:MAG: HD domain-containing protein, partial [Proteobacteria bacterium]|nr:HD domain-containing protein [Pseudomonadota bacterium]